MRALVKARALKTLVVLIEGRRAGTLVAEPSGALHLTYDDDFAGDPDATPLSLSLPLTGGRYTDKAVAPVIAGLLPDNENVLERWGRLFSVSARNPFALLVHVGEDCAGAVQLVPETRVDELDPGHVEWLSDGDIASMLAGLRSDPNTWQQRAGARGGHFSLAGAQAKFALLHHGGRWGRPSGAIPTTHIFKPTIAGIADHDINEHLCLRAASALGLAAAQSQITRFGTERAVVLTRFDRSGVAGPDPGDIVRVHQEDMVQALGRPPAAKYQVDGGPTPREIVALLRDHQPRAVAAIDVERFVLALVYNWVIAGTDAHGKNYGVLLRGREARLTPLYDVASALLHPEFNRHKWELAMKVNKQGRLKYLAGKDWEAEARAVNVDIDLIVDTVDRFTAAICDAILTVAGEPAVVETRSELPAHLVDAIAIHGRDVRAAMGLSR